MKCFLFCSSVNGSCIAEAEEMERGSRSREARICSETIITQVLVCAKIQRHSSESLRIVSLYNAVVSFSTVKALQLSNSMPTCLSLQGGKITSSCAKLLLAFLRFPMHRHDHHFTSYSYIDPVSTALSTHYRSPSYRLISRSGNISKSQSALHDSTAPLNILALS